MIDSKIPRRSFLAAAAMAGLGTALDWGGINALAAKIQPKKDFPIVVIGAGLGGLCCGALLAKRGFPVTVLEQHNIPGGYATSFERAGGRFTFDVSLHRMSLDDNLRRLFEELGVLDKIDLVEIPDDNRLVTPLEDVRVLSDDKQFARWLIQKYPQEKVGLEKYFAAVNGVADQLMQLRASQDRSGFAQRYPKLWDIRDKTLAEFVGGFIKDPGLKEYLTLSWQAYGLPPSRLSAFFYVVANSSRKNSHYIKMRSQDLSSALADIIEQAGGKIIYETLIDKILLKNKAVSGVVTADGKQLPAKVVVSNASAVATFNQMLPPQALPPAYKKKTGDYRPSLSIFIVWLGLNQGIREKIKDAKINVMSGRGAEADYLSCINGEVEKTSSTAILYDNYFKGYSRPGTSTLTITTMSGYEPWKRFAADYKAGNKAAYHKEKQRWASIIMRRIEEKAIPGLSSMVEVLEAATPLTNWYYTRNTQGAVYGFEQSVDNSFMTRIRNSTPLKGLYLAGAWGYPGGGYTGALRGGQRSFVQIMKDWT